MSCQRSTVAPCQSMAEPLPPPRAMRLGVGPLLTSPRKRGEDRGALTCPRKREDRVASGRIVCANLRRLRGGGSRCLRGRIAF